MTYYEKLLMMTMAIFTEKIRFTVDQCFFITHDSQCKDSIPQATIKTYYVQKVQETFKKADTVQLVDPHQFWFSWQEESQQLEADGIEPDLLL